MKKPIKNILLGFAIYEGANLLTWSAIGMGIFAKKFYETAKETKQKDLVALRNHVLEETFDDSLRGWKVIIRKNPDK